MKKYILSVFFLALIINLSAANYKYYRFDDDEEIRTIFKPGTSGGYGSIYMQYSTINRQDAVFVGGRGGWIIGHGLSMGFGGAGYFNRYLNTNVDTVQNTSGGHGGFFIEPILLPRFPVHLALPVFLGAGSISQFEYYAFEDNDNDNDNDNDIEGHLLKTDSYFIIEPGAELQFNLLKHVRFSAGVSYTYTTKVNMKGYLSDTPLNGLKYNMRLTFGKF